MPATSIGREVLLHPRLMSCAVPEPRRGRSLPIAGDEVPHFVVGDIALELGERRRVVRAGEPADRHDRRAGLQFEAARRHRADGGCRPALVGALDELRERGLSASAPPGPTAAGRQSRGITTAGTCRHHRARHAWLATVSMVYAAVRGHAEKHCAGGQYGRGAAQPVSTDHEHRRDDHRSGQHDPAQRGQPIRRAVQQDERPDAGDGRHGRQHDPRREELPCPATALAPRSRPVPRSPAPARPCSTGAPCRP